MNRRQLIISIWVIVCTILILADVLRIEDIKEAITHLIIGFTVIIVGWGIFLLANLLSDKLWIWGNAKLRRYE